MRKQARPPAPAILVEQGNRWSQQWVALRARNPAASFQWYEHEGKSARDWLLPHLKAMTQDHCAFCDCFPLEDRSRLPIEHFKPKHDPQFHAEAYAWENLYLSCESCQAAKHDRWDSRLLRPDSPDYDFQRYFVFDFTTGEMKSNPIASEADQQRAHTTCELYGLDSSERRRFRLLELRRWQRSQPRELDEWAYRDFLELESAPAGKAMT